MYIQLVKPKIFYGGHSDNFNIGASPYYHQALQRQFDIFAIPESQQPEVRGWHDPYDYLRFSGLRHSNGRTSAGARTPARARSTIAVP